ncbi:substrate-binding periplasmic protein [Salidesulfovibrio onnuriiensis]|uniref:substrate-binding periplasmic protein n=1 Tax=Salidesulfovibrio onnuriiensis TaxID=2583823 RepID=UPI0016505101|nr:transporter substrate-binding domain-containing protein [Salidesulfovibrio onnuriiensis]
MIKYFAIALATFLLMLPGGICNAEEEKVTSVLAVGPSWDKFTNEDGTGLYHEILNKVFGLYGIEVKREYMPSIRAYKLVAGGDADMMTCKAYSVDKPLALARYPMFVNHYHVFFNKDRIGPWHGRKSLNNKFLVWRVSYYLPSEFQDVDIQFRELTSGQQALGMILLGRADFYVDDINFIEDSINKNRIPFDPTRYDIQTVGTRSYHPVFNTSERGREIMKLYDEGVRKLHKTGELKPIFEKWGFEYPDYDSY